MSYFAWPPKFPLPRTQSLKSIFCPYRELSRLQVKSPLAQQKRRKLWVAFVCSIARRLGYEVVDEMERARQVLASLFYLSYPSSTLLLLTLQRFRMQHQCDKKSHQALHAIGVVANPHRGRSPNQPPILKINLSLCWVFLLTTLSAHSHVDTCIGPGGYPYTQQPDGVRKTGSC